MNKKREEKTLSNLFKKAIKMLEKAKLDYLVIGGVAVSNIGEPRLTEDLDLILFIKKGEGGEFLKIAKGQGFEVNEKEEIDNLKSTGCFRIFWTPLRLDIICASTDFEQEALRRKQKLNLYGLKANFPTPEDLIILKIIPGRAKDMLDAESIALRHRKKLDILYLENRVKKICEESENLVFWKNLQKVLKASA